MELGWLRPGVGATGWGRRGSGPVIVPLPFLCEVCRMDDGLVEVVGLSSSLHVGRIQVNVDEPLRIGQAREVKAG